MKKSEELQLRQDILVHILINAVLALGQIVIRARVFPPLKPPFVYIVKQY